MGIRCHKVTERTGEIVSILAVTEEDSVLMITTEGVLIRMACSSISLQGRNTMGVRLMNLAPGVTVAGAAKVKEDKPADAAAEAEQPEDTKQPAAEDTDRPETAEIAQEE